MPQKNVEEKLPEIEIEDEEFDMDIDDDETVSESPSASDDLREMLKTTIHKEVSASHEKMKAYLDKRLEPVVKKTKNNTESIVKLEQRVEGIENVLQQLNTLPKQSKAKPERTGILDKTLGTVGDILHGTVDTAAFVLETGIDLVTLGKARR